MPSTPDPILGVELQALGENLNTWGETKLNDALSQIGEAIKSGVSIAVEGPVTLTSTHYVSNQARRAVLVFTGTGGETVTLSGKQAKYLVFNDCAGSVTLSDGGETVVVAAGETEIIWSDGADVRAIGLAGLSSRYLALEGGTMTGPITLPGEPTENLHASTKKYVDDTAFDAAAGKLPGQSGNAGKFLTTDGTTASWSALDSDLEAIAAETTTERGRKSLTWGEVAVSGDVSPAALWREYYVDTDTAARSITFPAGTDAGRIRVIDADGNAEINTVTITPDGSETIMGESSLVIDIKYFSGEFRYRAADTNWELV